MKLIIFPIAQNSIERIFNVYIGSDWDSAKAIGANLGKKESYKAQCLNAVAQNQIKNVDASFKSKNPVSESHGKYHELPFNVASLINTELKCEKSNSKKTKNFFNMK